MVDVLLVGATGYTGGLVTRYLSTHRDRETFTFAVAGRSKAKLDKVVSDYSLTGVQVFIVDLTDEESVKTLLNEAKPKVVLTTAGPFIKWGKPLVRACAQSGVHYVDIGGEAPFVKELIDEVDALAKETKAVLVPSSGFDSVPSDAIAFLAALTLRSTLRSIDQPDTANIGVAESYTIISGRGGVSGGTISSTFNLLETVPLKDLLASQAPDFLSPTKLRSPRPLKFVSSLPVVTPKKYGGITPLIPFNISVVHRSQGLFQLHADRFDKNTTANDTEDENVNTLPAYSDDYHYTESWATYGPISAFSLSLSVTVLQAFLLFPPFRWLAKRALPAPGEGPSEKALANGHLEMHNISISTPLPSTGKPIVIETHLRGHGDPGYALTAVTASEVALGLLTSRDKLPPLAREGGVLTSSTALGPLLIKRLSASGKFEFESRVREDGSK